MRNFGELIWNDPYTIWIVRSTIRHVTTSTEKFIASVYYCESIDCEVVTNSQSIDILTIKTRPTVLYNAKLMGSSSDVTHDSSHITLQTDEARTHLDFCRKTSVAVLNIRFKYSQ